MHKRVAKTISDLEIETLADRSIFSMSGGEKQLLAFASVYAMNPQVYVLDEPSANLDHEAMGKLRKILEIVKKGDHTVLIAEHRLSYLYGLADRIVYLKAGCIERVFTAAEFAGLPESERSASGVQLLCLRRKTLCRSLPEITGKIGFLPLHRPLPFLFVPAVAVGPAGGKGILPHKICRTACFAHGVVQTAQRGSEVI